MKSLALIVSHGSHNAMVQAFTLIMAAVSSELAVRVFFRDEAIFKITKARAHEIHLSAGYRGLEQETMARLKAQRLSDLPTLMREVKTAGDVRLYACSSSMAICGVKPEDLLDEIDEIRGITAFLLEDVGQADRVLTF
jgi:peroxiredoxin family protein